MGTHFSQETLLKQSIQLAEKLQLPTVLHLTDLKSVERAVEMVFNEAGDDDENEDESNSQVFIIHDVLTCTGADLDIRDTLVKFPNVYFVVSGAGLADPDEAIKEKSRAFVKGLPVDRILIATDSPWRTPQNLADPYLRTIRNEPANIPAVIEAIGEIVGVDKNEIMNTVKETSLRLFNLEFLSPELAAAAKLHMAHENSVEEVTKSVQKVNIKAEYVHEESTADSSKQEQPVSNKPAAQESAEYKCTKCRTLLFKPKDITTHQLGASKTVFKVGEEGLCASFIFVAAQDGREIHKRLGVSIRGGNVECTHCGTKLGKFSPGEAVCPCGALVTGPVAKINATKTDYSDNSMNAQELAERAKIEIEDAQRQAEMEDQEMEEKWQNQQGRVKKAKKHKSENRGNFSNFRNKSFIPNASKTANENAPKETGKDQVQSKKGYKGHDSDEDEEYDSQEGEEEEDN